MKYFRVGTPVRVKVPWHPAINGWIGRVSESNVYTATTLVVFDIDFPEGYLPTRGYLMTPSGLLIQTTLLEVATEQELKEFVRHHILQRELTS